MHFLGVIVGIAVIVVVLVDAFESIILPRRVMRIFRLTRLFYRFTWRPWSAAAKRVPPGARRENVLSFYGPVSLILLLFVWACGLVMGFALLHWSVGSGGERFFSNLYFSGSAFFTLGLADVVPQTPLSRIATILEAGVGLGFLAIVIGYLPVMYQAFSQREVNISLLDARAGSPSTAAELLRRHFDGEKFSDLGPFLRDWERWAGEVLETHLSYPVLAYYRSQHSNQSWLSALTTILDVSTLLIVGVQGAPARQAQLTFAIARHAVADLAHTFNATPREPNPDRLPPAEFARLRGSLAARGIIVQDGLAAEEKLYTLRRMYEPYVNSLSEYLLMPLPAWEVSSANADNWQVSAWGRVEKVIDDHF